MNKLKLTSLDENIMSASEIESKFVQLQKDN